MPFGARSRSVRPGAPRAALDRPRGADAADLPAVGAAARVDEELEPGAGAHGHDGRLGGDLAHGDARLAADLARDGREHGGRGADVAGAVAHRDDDHVRAGRGGRAVDLAVPDPAAAARAALEARDLARRVDVRAQHAEARRPAAADAAGADLEAAGRRARDRRLDRQHDRRRGRRVDVERARHDDRPARAAQAELHAVEPVGGLRALVGLAVPDHGHRPRGGGVEAVREAADAPAVAVEDRDRQLVGLLDRERDPGDVAAAVAVGREVAPDLRDLRDGLRALEPLGDEERSERRRHEQREDDAGELAHRSGLRGPCRCRRRRRRPRPRRRAPGSRRPSRAAP